MLVYFTCLYSRLKHSISVSCFMAVKTSGMFFNSSLPEIWDKMTEIMQITIQHGDKIRL